MKKITEAEVIKWLTEKKTPKLIKATKKDTKKDIKTHRTYMSLTPAAPEDGSE